MKTGVRIEVVVWGREMMILLIFMSLDDTAMLIWNLENKINKEPFVLHLHSYHQNKQGFSSPKNPFGALSSLAYKAVRPERVSSALGTAFLPCNHGHSSAWQRPALPHEMHRDDHCSSLSPGTVPWASDSLVM